MDYMDDDVLGDFQYLDYLENGGAESEDIELIMDAWLEAGAISQEEYENYFC